MIKKEKGKYVLYSKDGSKKLGTFNTDKEAKDREKEINAIKHSALIEIPLYITKASQQKDGTMRWLATCSDTEKDKTYQATSIQLFNDWIERAETGKELAWLPPPRTPFLGLSHYPDLQGFGEAGLTDKMYVEGNQFKAGGTFHSDENHPLGKALFEAVRKEKALIEKGETIEKPIRISAGWWDIAHKHGDFIFERKSLEDVCPMCANGGDDKIYLKGQLDHFAATRVPINPRTALALEEKAMTTRKQDADSIIEDPELVEELDEKAAQLTGKSETELPPAMVVRGDGETPDTEKMEDDEMMHLPFGGAMSIADAEKYMAAQEQVNAVYTEWSLFRTVMGNILDMSEPGEVKAKVSGLVKEFSGRVDAIKASIEDVYLTQSTGGLPMADDTPKQEENKSEAFDLDEAINKALTDAGLTREQKAAAIQQAYNTHAEAVKAKLDVAAPPDIGESIQKAMTPYLEKLDLVLAKIGGQQPAPQAPVQKSLMPNGMPIPTGQNQLPVSPITGQPSALRAMIERSVQAR